MTNKRRHRSTKRRLRLIRRTLQQSELVQGEKSGVNNSGLIEWLKRNKVIFETIIPVMLTVVSIVLSVGALVSASKTNELSEIMMSFEKHSFEPRIEVYADDYGGMNYSRIRVDNTGYSVTDVDGRSRVLLRCMYRDGQKECKEDFLLPLFYYSVNHRAYHGEIYSFFEDSGYYDKIQDLLYERAMRHEEMPDISLSLERYAMISYIDYFGESETRYYHVSSNGAVSEIERSYGEDVFTKSYSNRELSIYKSMTLDTLIGTIVAYFEK